MDIEGERTATAGPDHDTPASLGPSALAVGDAVLCHRQTRQLDRAEFLYVLDRLGYPLTIERLTDIEAGRTAATVDDLIAFSNALDVTPVTLLTHVPLHRPIEDGPMATTLPADAHPQELRDWMQGRTTMDVAGRVRWHQRLVSMLEVRALHHEEQLDGAHQELRDLGELAVREADMPPVIRLHERIRSGEHAVVDTDLALALARQRLEQLTDDHL